MSDDPVSRILLAIERLRTDVLQRLARVEGLLESGPPATAVPDGDPAASPAEIVAHIQDVGDIEGNLGDWIGERGSGRWIEGISIAPQHEDVGPEEFLYRVILGRDQMSPWVRAGTYCGSVSLALPLRGFCVTLNGEAAARFECRYSATFVGGTQSPLLAGGQVCALPTLVPLEAFQITLRPRAP